MNSKSLPLFRGELALCIAVLMNSFGVVLMLYSGAGISAISSVPFAFSEVWPVLTLGTWTYLFQGCLVLSLMLLRKKFVPSYLFSFVVGFVFGKLLDVHEAWINVLPYNIPMRVVYFVVSYCLISLGIALSNRCKLPNRPHGPVSPGAGRYYGHSVPQNQNWLRCHLSGSDGRPDAGFPPPSGGPGHRHHCGGVYHGQGHWLCG